MHGEAIDWVVLNTIKDGLEMPTGEEHNGTAIKNYLHYEFESLPEQPIYKKVLDLGSLDINGTLRNYHFLHENFPLWIDLIRCEEYIGIDLLSGPSVDIVMNSHKLSFPDNAFDLVMSLNVLEHDSDPQATISEGARVLKLGGTFLIACPVETFLEHKELGGGNCETYNFITSEKLNEWLDKAGLKINKLIRTDIGHLVNATK